MTSHHLQTASWAFPGGFKIIPHRSVGLTGSRNFLDLEITGSFLRLTESGIHGVWAQKVCLINPPDDSEACSRLRIAALKTDLKRSDIIGISDVPISGKKDKIKI